MVIAYDADEVARYMRAAVEYSQERPVLVDHFLENAVEVDVDALCDSEDVIIAGIMQHIEEAGIHSGDSSCVLPAVDIREGDSRYYSQLTRANWHWHLKVVGLVNLQFAIQRDGDGQDQGLCDRGESAGLAYRAVCVEGDRDSAGQDRGAADDRAQAARVDA